MRQKFICFAALAVAAATALVSGAAGAAETDAEWALHKESTDRRDFTVPATAAGFLVSVDNYSGAIHVRAGKDRQIRLTAHRHDWAPSQNGLAEAQRAVRLDVTQDAHGMRFYVDGPFRSRDHNIDFNGWQQAGFQVRLDFEIEVPAGVSLDVRTVNDGDVRVSGVDGHFDVSNVNGGIALERLGGAGKAHTVNGPLQAEFRRNPTAACSFATVNGRIDVGFRPGFAAGLLFKTINGEVYTDFPYSSRPLPETVAPSSTHPHFRLQSKGEFGARIGSGGPEIDFSTINGDILVHRRDAATP